MVDINSSLVTVDIAMSRLNWYIGVSVFASIVSVAAIVISFVAAKRQLENNKLSSEKALENSQKQLQANHDWNRRSFTSSQIRNMVNDLKQIRDDLDNFTASANKIIKNNEGNYINFTDRLYQDDQLCPDEVHLWVCEHDDSGKHVPSKSGKNPPCKTSANGEKIVNKMLEFINVYEQIGIAVKNGIFDEQTVIDAFKNPIRWNYIFYSKYIEHRILEHQDTNFAASFKWLYYHLWIENVEEKRKNTEEI